MNNLDKQYQSLLQDILDNGIEKKDRIDDALQATKAALEEGILPGAGVALLNARNAISKRGGSDFGNGGGIVFRACSKPFYQILNNAGEDSNEWYNILRNTKNMVPDIAGDTSGTWNTTTGRGLGVTFGLGSGSTYTGTAGSWQSANLVQPTSTGSVVGTNGATWYITGVQLEKGSTATSFDVRPYGTELSLCQRYYYRAVNGNTQPITNGFYYSSTDIRGIINFPCTMRISPSLVSSSGTDHFRLQAVGSDDTFDTLLDAGPKSTTSMYLYINSNVSGTAGNAGAILSNNASASLAFNSEL